MTGSQSPTLVVLSPGADQGRRIALDRDELVVGRAGSSDVRFDDPGVSRTHAVLRRHGPDVFMVDTGSTSGTYVNRTRLTGQRQLRPGDEIAMAGVLLRFETPQSAGGVHYTVDSQQAGTINNVGRDQYLVQQRENFLREVARTRTRARWLVLLGFALTVVGFAMFAGGVLSFLEAIPEYDGLDPSQEIPTPFGDDVLGVPSGLLGWALAAAGGFALLAGLIMHVVATSRRKRADHLGSYR